MSQFKRFNTSESGNYDSSAAYPEGTLTWDPSNGLRLHDGGTYGGNAVGGSSNFYDLTNRPNGNTAVHDLQGGSNSAYNGYYLKQTNTGVSEWAPAPTTYDTLTIDTKIIGGIDGAAGTKITGIEATLGSGVPYRYAFIGGNEAFGNLFNRGSALIGWKMYPASNPSADVTITEFLNNDLGAPSLGFSNVLDQGPWIAESPDYNAGTPGPLTLSADTKDWVLGTDGSLTLPVGGDIKNSDGDSVLLRASDSPEFAGLYINSSSGDEGGEIRLALAETNTTLSGTGITIDVYQNKLRFFEQGGSARGFYIDITKGSSSVSTDLTPKSEPPFTLKYQTFTADANTRYCIDAVGSAVTSYLPTNPTIGDAVLFVDAYGSFNTNNLTIDGNGKNIMGSSTLVVSTANQKVGVFYNGSEWRTY